MGYFCGPKGERSGDHVECAIGNLNLFLNDWKHDRGTIYCSQPYPNDYLIDFAIHELQAAKERYKEECKVNPNVNPPIPPPPKVDIQMALNHSRLHEVHDCQLVLYFVIQNDISEIDKFMSILLTNGVGWTAGMCSVLRFTWKSRDKLKHWYELRDACKTYMEMSGEDPYDGLLGLLDLKPNSV